MTIALRLLHIVCGVLWVGALGLMVMFIMLALLAERGIPFLFTSGVDVAREPPQFHRSPRLLKPFSDQELHSALSGLLAPPRTVPPIAPFAA